MIKCIYLKALTLVQDLGEGRVIVSPSIGVLTGRGYGLGLLDEVGLGSVSAASGLPEVCGQSGPTPKFGES
jgi:hypothetical protein